MASEKDLLEEIQALKTRVESLEGKDLTPYRKITQIVFDMENGQIKIKARIIEIKNGLQVGTEIWQDVTELADNASKNFLKKMEDKLNGA